MRTDHIETARVLLEDAVRAATLQIQMERQYASMRNVANDPAHIARVSRSFYEWFHGPQADQA